jgi:hypothetical protein
MAVRNRLNEGKEGSTRLKRIFSLVAAQCSMCREIFEKLPDATAIIRPVQGRARYAIVNAGEESESSSFG